MRHCFVRWVFASLVVLGVTGCPTQTEAVCDGGFDDPEVCELQTAPPDRCDSREEALTNALCKLVVGTSAQMAVTLSDAYISTLADGGVDEDWYLAEMPTLTGRSLLHVKGGYSVTSTPVNFSVNVMRATPVNGQTGVTSGVDRHGSAAPKLVDLTIPFDESNSKLFIVVSDDATGSVSNVDNRNPYSLSVEVVENPDVNEPNDEAPTPIALTSGTDALEGSSSGFLATDGDVDLYKFAVPTSADRQIVYLKLSGPATQLVPPPNYALSYVLSDSQNRPVAEGGVAFNFSLIDLSTAVLAAPGDYTLKIVGRPEPGSSVAKGDHRLKYDVTVRIFKDLDVSEGTTGNDSIATPKAVNLGVGSSQTVKGRISYVSDSEWISIFVPAAGSASTLRYKFTASSGGGRFAPLTPSANRQLRLHTQVTTGTTLADKQNACIMNNTACPKAYTDRTAAAAGTVEDVCKATGFDPPLCLWSERNELDNFDDLKNHEGAIPIPAGGAGPFYLLIRDQGSVKYADDREWTLTLSRVDDPDEQSRVAGATVATFGVSQVVSSGTLTFGHGRLRTIDPTRGTGIRGAQDYDAYETDTDLHQFNFDALTTVAQGWELEWEIFDAPGTMAAAGDVTLDVTFCTGPLGSMGLCTGAKRITLGYVGSNLPRWYIDSSDASSLVVQFSKERSLLNNSTIIKALPIGCWCFSDARVTSGQFFVNVVAADRISNVPIQYEVRQRIAAHPAFTCPTTAACAFAP